ncbi:PepSY-associated TM helix domain-containing protein [Xanthomonadaceae bacterium JHOS43]|nr:PepSY-associated TM helix domain-containing protein [Xanthomonadaceae bacterium JHOS43]MCX7564119.1 PepSY-associated TM helix domain-containing protein [Xanthomonadaceae bacterium XH05]
MSSSRSNPTPDPQRRAFWLRTLHQWHWISSALCLIGLLLFAITGVTLNHASQIPASPATTTIETELPDALRDTLQAMADDIDDRAPLPLPLRDFIADAFDLRVGAREAEWSADEIYLSLPRPGGDGWLSIDLGSGRVEHESTDRGWVSYFNDLHKGRNTGPAWRWFIDVFALACLVFSITGLVLLQLHARQRGLTWPMVGLGALVPLLIALLLIH